MRIFVIFCLILFVSASCKKKGCTDPLAINYDVEAEKNDNSCEYEMNYTLYFLDSVALQYQNEGVIGFLITPNVFESQFGNVFEFIDISESTASIPNCGEGVWSYSEFSSNKNHSFYYGSPLQLSKVTSSDTLFVQWINPSFNGIIHNICNKVAIRY